MKIVANLEFRNGEEASKLVLSFFKEFNSESKIMITGDKGTVEVVFANLPPLETIEAICNCKIVSFVYDNNTKMDVETRDVPKQYEPEELEAEDNSEQVEPEELEVEDDPEQVEPEELEAEDDSEQVEPEESETKDVFDCESVLEEIALKATSRENFAMLLGEFLDMGNKQEQFEKLVLATFEVDKVNWPELDAKVTAKGVENLSYFKVCLRAKVSFNFNMPLLNFLKEVKTYEEYSFKSAPAKSKLEYMPYMPEEILRKVNEASTSSIKATTILKSMGLEDENSNKQEKIKNICYGIIYSKNVDIDNFLSKTSSESRMVLSEFINNFIEKRGFDQKVRTVDFLEDLRRICGNQ